MKTSLAEPEDEDKRCLKMKTGLLEPEDENKFG
jgi:hypothetical protein